MSRDSDVSSLRDMVIIRPIRVQRTAVYNAYVDICKTLPMCSNIIFDVLRFLLDSADRR